MTGEQFLNKIRGLTYEIRALDLQIDALDRDRYQTMNRRQYLLEKAASTGAALNGVCVRHPLGSKTENIGIELADLMTPEQVAEKINHYVRQINQKIDELVDKKRELMALKDKAQQIIGCIPDARYRSLLIHRYINNLQWNSVADIMGYTQNWVEVKLARKSIEAFEAAQKRVM